MAAIADTVRRRLSSRPGSAPADIWVRDRDFRSLGRGSYSLKQVLERLAWFCPTLDGSSVFPKIQTIADALGVTPRAVQYSLRRLEELGFIEVAMEAHQHVPRVYQINVEKILSFPLTETGRRSREKEVFAMRGEPAPKEPDQADEADEPDEPDEADEADEPDEPDEADKPETPKTPGVKSTSDDGDKPQIPRGEKYVDQG